MMDDELTEYPTRRFRLYPCQFCGRNFQSESLNKHQAVCRKTSHKKRRVFDTGRQRATGSDVPYKATRKTAQIYNGEVRAQDDPTKYRSKANWREKHRSLIESIRQARSVTRAVKQGAPLPSFRPSQVPSDYVACPYCRRNFNRYTAQRHIPFCQTQYERKQYQQLDRGRSLPPQQQSFRMNTNDGYQHSNSAPMIPRRQPLNFQRTSNARQGQNGSGNLRKVLSFGSKEDSRSSKHSDDVYDYQSSIRRPVQQPVVMRTGRTDEHDYINTMARQRGDFADLSARRVPVASTVSSSFRQSPGNSNRPTVAIRCNDCGNIFNTMSARYCSQCGSRR